MQTSEAIDWRVALASLALVQSQTSQLQLVSLALASLARAPGEFEVAI